MTVPILHYARVPWPVEWVDEFGCAAPLLLELGFGGGDFLIDLARRNPDANVIGFEISLPSLRRAARKAGTAVLPNLRIVQGESRGSLWLLFHPASISGVTINFPDPWPKTAHHHRRVINDAFLDLLATRMQTGAPLHIATDHADYADAISEVLARTPYFESTLDVPFVTEDVLRLGTKYERLALEAGRTCRYYRWRRNHIPAPDLFPILEEKPVPHAVLLSTLSLDAIGARFEPFAASNATIPIKFLAAYRALQTDGLLVEAYISEEPFHQRVVLSIRQRKDGDLVVSLHEVGFPRPTAGIHMAIGELVHWLQGEDPGLTVVSSTLIPAAPAPESISGAGEENREG